ncbi:MAG: hypothetical protein NTW87_10905 [Planctomycetota bacterium]|nr:hypothetical protein [Planctomycetota bacterium]
MGRYFLPCPKCGGTLQQKGQTGCEPIYHCRKCNSFWLLSLGSGFKRLLRSYDPNTGRAKQDADKVIGDDWEGEPSNIGVSPDTWSAALEPASSGTAVDVMAGIRSAIQNGDNLFLLNEEGTPTHRLVITDGNVVPVPL